MCRNISGFDLPLFCTVSVEAVERAGSDIVRGICHKKFAVFRIYRNAVWDGNFLIRAIGNEIFGRHFLCSCIDFCITYRVAIRYVTPLGTVQIQKVIAKSHIAAWQWIERVTHRFGARVENQCFRWYSIVVTSR